MSEIKTQRAERDSGTVTALVRKRIGLILAWPLILGLDVLILTTSSSGLTWSEIRATTRAGIKKAWKNPNATLSGA